MLQMKSTTSEKTSYFIIGGNHRKGCSKSKLEKYLDILTVLSCNCPMNLEQIIQHIELNYVAAIEVLSCLVKLNMVEEGNFKQGLTYSITEEGERVVRFFKNQSFVSRF